MYVITESKTIGYREYVKRHNLCDRQRTRQNRRMRQTYKNGIETIFTFDYVIKLNFVNAFDSLIASVVNGETNYFQ